MNKFDLDKISFLHDTFNGIEPWGKGERYIRVVDLEIAKTLQERLDEALKKQRKKEVRKR
jgi:hypothetical protein